MPVGPHFCIQRSLHGNHGYPETDWRSRFSDILGTGKGDGGHVRCPVRKAKGMTAAFCR